MTKIEFKLYWNSGALIRGRGMCSTFQSFQLTYHACTTFVEARARTTFVEVRARTIVILTWTPFHHPLGIPLLN